MTFQSVSTNHLMSGLTFAQHFNARSKELIGAQNVLHLLQTSPEKLPGVTLSGLIGEPTGQSLVCRGVFVGTRPKLTVAVAVAVKIYFKITSAATREIALLKQCNHPNIIPLLCDIDLNGVKALVLPLADRSLSSVGLVNNPRDIVRYAVQVSRALDYLHSTVSMSHLDVKAANTLVFPDGLVCFLSS
jgi:serine/threonine protein kinase